jgi:DNA repair protein RadA/Sms
VASLEGSRPILVELQALVTPSHVGMARRMVVGVDANRVSLLLAVLEKRAGLFVSGHDIFVNVVGGIELEEPAIDLGIAAAIASSFREKPVDPGTVLFGEVGLAGEIRAIQRPEVRVAEAAKMGFKRCLLPESSVKRMSASGGASSGGSMGGGASGVGGIELVPVRHLSEVIEQLT